MRKKSQPVKNAPTSDEQFLDDWKFLDRHCTDKTALERRRLGSYGRKAANLCLDFEHIFTAIDQIDEQRRESTYESPDRTGIPARFHANRWRFTLPSVTIETYEQRFPGIFSKGRWVLILDRETAFGMTLKSQPERLPPTIDLIPGVFLARYVIHQCRDEKTIKSSRWILDNYSIVGESPKGIRNRIITIPHDWGIKAKMGGGKQAASKYNEKTLPSNRLHLQPYAFWTKIWNEEQYDAHTVTLNVR